MADVGDDSLMSDIWASPTAGGPKPEQPKDHDRPKTPKTPTNQPTPDYDHDAALRRELQGVRNINQVIEGVLGTLERAKGNMDTVSKTVSDASALLNTWTRIVSQTEHNQRLILDPTWKGASQDLADVEAEAVQKKLAVERRAAEEERRREDARRRQEDEERRRAVAPTPTTRGTRGTRPRGRGIPRGGVSVYRTEPSSSLIPSARGTSGIGRGIGTSRTGRSRRVTR